MPRYVKEDTFANLPRITVIDATGKYIEYNRRWPKQNARCELAVYSHPTAKWTNIALEEYGESDAGNGRAKTISMTLDEKEGRALYEKLKTIYGA